MFIHQVDPLAPKGGRETPERTFLSRRKWLLAAGGGVLAAAGGYGIYSGLQGKDGDVLAAGKWTPEAETFFSSIEGKSGLNYAYGPLGNQAGMTAISGVCNCLSWTGPVSTVDGITTATAELRCSTRILGAFDASGVPVPPVTATGATAGVPGSFTPAGAAAPSNLAGMSGVTASPNTAWTTGQYVATSDGIHCNWNGTAWITGNAV